MNIDVTERLGKVTAYRHAVAGGFTGTEEQFNEMLANIFDCIEYAESAESSAESAAQSAEEAAESARGAFASTPEGYSDLVSQVDTNTRGIRTNTDKVNNLETLTEGLDARFAAQSAATEAGLEEVKKMIGYPLTASTVSAMFDTEKIYVYTGSEEGYNYGHWYYFDGSAWLDGGVYNAVTVQTDKTLLLEDEPADSKTAGDAIRALVAEVTDGRTDADGISFQNIGAHIRSIENDFTEVEDIREDTNGVVHESAGESVRSQISAVRGSMIASAYVEDGYLYMTGIEGNILVGPLGPFSGGGGGGGGSIGKFEIVANQAGLLKSTADKVLVLNNDSTFGDGGQCLFEVTDGCTHYGYQRTSDSKYMVPVPDQDVIVTANPPVNALMSVIKTWVGNENVTHMPASYTDTGSLFGETIRQYEGKWTMDCSAFISAVLMGITYQNSRYVLGNDKDNVTGEYFPGNAFPLARFQPARAKGGMGAAGMAEWFAEQKRLYSLSEDSAKALAQLQFGDIIFGSNSSTPQYYRGIEHVMFVLGTIPSQGILIAAESIVLSAETTYEQSGAHIFVSSLKDSTTGKTKDYYQVWARPDYSHIGNNKDVLIPKGANIFKYDPYFLQACLVCRGSSDSSTVPAGKLLANRYLTATPDFYPAVPGSVVSYTGAAQCDRGIYLCRVHEFDDTQKYLKSTTIAYATNGSPATSPVTIGSTTRYLKFTFGLQSGTMSDSSIGIWMSNIDDCEITMTLPTASASA